MSNWLSYQVFVIQNQSTNLRTNKIQGPAEWYTHFQLATKRAVVAENIRVMCLWVALALPFPLSAGLPDWAVSCELGYPKVVLATDFYDGRFANFWATGNYDEFWAYKFCRFLSLFLFSQDLVGLIVILRMSDMVPESTFFTLRF